MSGPGEAHETAEQFRRFSRRWIRERFPLAAELRHYTREKLNADLLAAATVALVSIPQAIGFALIAGLPPLMVIMSVIVGGFVGALFSASRQLVFGPTNSVSLILAATIFSFHGSTLTPQQIALLLALLVGLFQLAAGIAQLGKVTQFISRSVIVSYSTAIGLLLVASQAPYLLGQVAERGGFLGGLPAAVRQGAERGFDSPAVAAVAMGALTFLLFHLLERLAPRIPAELPGLLLLAGLTYYLHLGALGIRTIGDEAALGVEIPTFLGLPLNASNLHVAPPLLGSALAIAILGMLEAISIARTLAARSGQTIDANQELIAMGTANIVSSAYGAMPGSASFARSGANINSGARTQVAALASSVIVLVALFFVAPAINFIPVPSLAAHLVRIGWKMLNRDQIRLCWRATKSDAVVFATTMLAAFFLQLDIAIYVGVGVSLALFLRKAGAPSLVEYGFDDQGRLGQLGGRAESRHAAIAIVHVEGELFFGAADLFQEQVRRLAEDQQIKVVILRMKNARHLDATSVMSLLQLRDFLRQSGRHLLVSGISPDVERVLRRSGGWERIGDDNIFLAEANPTLSTKRALQRATRLLRAEGDSGKPEIAVFYDRRQEDAREPATVPPENRADYEI